MPIAANTISSAMQPRAFTNIFPPTDPSNTTLGHPQGHQGDLFNPFIASSQVFIYFSFKFPFIYIFQKNIAFSLPRGISALINL
jgi:hypothetical protein